MSNVIKTAIKWLEAELICNRDVLEASDITELEETIEALKIFTDTPMSADELQKRVQDIKDLGVRALISGNPVDKARYETTFWALMNNHGTQILDIVDDALQAYKEGKI